MSNSSSRADSSVAILDGASKVLAGIRSGLPVPIFHGRLGHACRISAGMTDWRCSNTGHN